MTELTINGIDAWNAWGVKMGDGFIDALCSSGELKSFIENESRAEDGKRVLVTNIRKASREITLTFTIQGVYNKDIATSKSSFTRNMKRFIAELEKGIVDIQIPTRSSEIFHLIYAGKGVKYKYSRNFTFCSFVAKFIEPNPANRV